MKKYALLNMFLLLLISCRISAQKNNNYPKWLNSVVFYQIYPQSFKDSNGDGIGDLNGIIEKLPYVKSLGVNAIWLNPCFSSTFLDAGYDVTDFYQIASRYGTNADMVTLVQKSHKLGIKVVLDLVAGHTSIEHPWFKASAKKEQNEFSERYIWTNSKKVKPYGFVANDYPRDGTYKKNFFETQPALNYGYAHPDSLHSWEQSPNAPGPVATREALKAIMAFWMNKGVDGFRVDMASSLIKNDIDFSETYKLWGNIRSWFSSKYPQGVLISEWSNPAQAIKAGFMIDFMIHFGVKGYPSLFFEDKDVVLPLCKNPFFAKSGKGDIMEFLNSYTKQQKQIQNQGLIAIPTANHDFQRLRSGTRQTTDELKVALVFLFTWQSVPFIYYGDEIGMKYISTPLPDKEGSILPAEVVPGFIANRAGSRTPMQWDNSKNAGISKADSSKLYLPVDPDSKRPTVADQEKDRNSLLNFTRQLIKLKNENRALSGEGKLEIVYAKEKTYPFIYKRKLGKNEFLICINPKDSTVQIDIPFSGNVRILPRFSQKTSCIKLPNGNVQVEMKPVSFGIFQLKNDSQNY